MGSITPSILLLSPNIDVLYPGRGDMEIRKTAIQGQAAAAPRAVRWSYKKRLQSGSANGSSPPQPSRVSDEDNKARS